MNCLITRNFSRIFLWFIFIIGIFFLITPKTEAAFLSIPNTSPYALSGNVYTNAIGSDGTVYIGGDFDSMTQNVASGVPINITTGAPVTTFPTVSGGNVTTVISDGSGGWYIGGTFTSVGGLTRNRLAHINSDSTVDATWNPNMNSTVSTLVLSGSKLYAGGQFTTVNSSITRNRLAAFNLTDGTVDGTWNPNVNSSVLAIVISGSKLYAGGGFTTVNIGAPTVTRNRLAAFNLTDGTVDATWNPNVGGTVNTIIISGSKLYAGGNFTTVNTGAPTVTRNRLAAFNLTDGTVDATWNPSVNNAVNSISISGSTLYAGGSFFSVNTLTTPVTRNRLAAFNLTNGTVDGTWNPNILVSGPPLTSHTVNAIVISGSTLYAGGIFEGVNGNTMSRTYLAAFNLTDGAVDPTFSLAGMDTTVSALAISGSTLYVGGSFTQVIIARFNLAAFDGTTGTLTSWNPDILSGGTVTTIAISGSKLYVGGGFNTVNSSTTPVTRNNLAAFNLTDGTVDSTWDPDSSDYVNAITVSGSTLYAGGNFTSVNNSTTPVTRNYIAAFNLTDGTVDATWNPNLDNSVNTITVSGSTLYAGGSFTTVNGSTTRNSLAAFNLTNGNVNASWNPNTGALNTVFSIFVSGSTLYAGGSFTTVNGSTTRNNIAAFNLTNGTVDST